MSHWYELPVLKKRLDHIQELTGFRYEHRGEALTVFDSRGCLAVLCDIDRGLDFVRIIESMEKICDALVSQRMSNLLAA